MRKNKTIKIVMVAGLVALLLLHGKIKDTIFKDKDETSKVNLFSFDPEFYKLTFLGYDEFSSRFLIFSLQDEEWHFQSPEDFQNASKALELISKIDENTYYPYFLGTLFAFVSRSEENANFFLPLLNEGIKKFKQNSWLPFRVAMLYKHIYYDYDKALKFAKIARDRELKYSKHPAPFIIAYPITVNDDLNTQEDFKLYISSLVNEVSTENPEAKKDIIKKLKKLLKIEDNS